MPVGQQLLCNTLDVGAVLAVEVWLSDLEAQRSAVHAGQLRAVLQLHRLYSRDGLGLGVQAQLALVLGCSEYRAEQLLTAGLLLVDLPGALEALECGLLGVEQARVVVDQLQPLPDHVRLGVWERVRAQLVADHDGSVVRPPARLRTLVSGWVISADPAGAVARRKDRARDADVDYRRRDDGLVDLFANGLTGPDAHACLSKLRACAEPVGSADDRPAGKRRLDALVDLILGRNPLPVGTDDENAPEPAGVAGGAGHCGPGCSCRTGCAATSDGATPAGNGAPCGCRPGSPVPCGAELTVLIPFGAALGTTDELAELIGHGPLEPDLLADLLQAAPRLRPVWVDPEGVPVAVGDTVERPERDDPASVRDALLRLASSPPGAFRPRHPDDHPSRTGPAGKPEPPGEFGRPEHGPGPDSATALPQPQPQPQPPGVPFDDEHEPAAVGDRPRLRTRPHPAGTPGPYRVPVRLRRFLQIRSPLCEWPGCGCLAVRCDLDHDIPWPAGATCSCDLGPACRRHHRIKQLGWTKQRTRDAGVRWTSPAGQSWNSPVQHRPPQAPVRGVTELPRQAGPLDQLSPTGRDDELRHTDPADPRWDDPAGLELRADDTEPGAEPHDPLGETLLRTDTRWTHDLDDPYRWLPSEA